MWGLHLLLIISSACAFQASAGEESFDSATAGFLLEGPESKELIQDERQGWFDSIDHWRRFQAEERVIAEACTKKRNAAIAAAKMDATLAAARKAEEEAALASKCVDTIGGAGTRGDKNFYGDGLGDLGTAADNCVKYKDINYCVTNGWLRDTDCRRTCGTCNVAGSCFDKAGGAGTRGDKNTYGDRLGDLGTEADNCRLYKEINYCNTNGWVKGIVCRRTCGDCVAD
jgi:hypothetical protein